MKKWLHEITKGNRELEALLPILEVAAYSEELNDVKKSGVFQIGAGENLTEFSGLTAVNALGLLVEYPSLKSIFKKLGDREVILNDDYINKTQQQVVGMLGGLEEKRKAKTDAEVGERRGFSDKLLSIKNNIEAWESALSQIDQYTPKEGEGVDDAGIISGDYSNRRDSLRKGIEGLRREKESLRREKETFEEGIKAYNLEHARMQFVLRRLHGVLSNRLSAQQLTGKVDVKRTEVDGEAGEEKPLEERISGSEAKPKEERYLRRYGLKAFIGYASASFAAVCLIAAVYYGFVGGKKDNFDAVSSVNRPAVVETVGGSDPIGGRYGVDAVGMSQSTATSMPLDEAKTEGSAVKEASAEEERRDFQEPTPEQAGQVASTDESTSNAALDLEVKIVPNLGLWHYAIAMEGLATLDEMKNMSGREKRELYQKVAAEKKIGKVNSIANSLYEDNKNIPGVFINGNKNMLITGGSLLVKNADEGMRKRLGEGSTLEERVSVQIAVARVDEPKTQYQEEDTIKQAKPVVKKKTIPYEINRPYQKCLDDYLGSSGVDLRDKHTVRANLPLYFNTSRAANMKMYSNYSGVNNAINNYLGAGNGEVLVQEIVQTMDNIGLKWDNSTNRYREKSTGRFVSRKDACGVFNALTDDLMTSYSAIPNKTDKMREDVGWALGVISQYRTGLGL